MAKCHQQSEGTLHCYSASWAMRLLRVESWNCVACEAFPFPFVCHVKFESFKATNTLWLSREWSLSINFNRRVLSTTESHLEAALQSNVLSFYRCWNNAAHRPVRLIPNIAIIFDRSAGIANRLIVWYCNGKRTMEKINLRRWQLQHQNAHPQGTAIRLHHFTCRF